MANSKDIKRGVVGAIIISIFILAFLILKPIIVSIIFGLLFAYIFGPVYKVIKKKTKNKNLSASLLMLGIVIIIAIPIFYLIPIIIRQSSETYILLRNFDFGQILNNFMENDIASILSINFDNIIYKIFSVSQSQFTSMIKNFPSVLLKFAVFLFTFYFAIRDSDELREYISSLSPFSSTTEEKILKEFRGITNAIVFGQVFIGIVQGLAVGACLFFLGVPNVLILTFIASIVSIIPIIGSWIVWLPVGIFLLINGQTFSAIFLILYGAIFVSIIDNLLRPYILSKQSNLPIVLSVIGTIGGLYFFGITGILLGPLILAYILIIIEFYQKGKLKDLFNK